MTGQWTYVDVGAARIQHYVSRTPRLKGQRGASAWLCDATSPEYVRQILAEDLAEGGPLAVPGIDVNPEAGEADGIVSVRFPAGPDPAPVAEELAARLRLKLPAVELAAWWGSGPSYLGVYRDHEKARRAARRDAPGSLESLPAPGDFPPLATCVECRADPAVATIDILDDRGLQVCLDCKARYEDRYRRPGLARGARRLAVQARRDEHDEGQEDDSGRGLPVYWEETKLADDLGRHPVRGTVQTFTELARLGSEATNRNHLATMYADGNKIGDFFKRIAEHGDPDLKARASAAVSAATRAALLEATRAAVTDADGTGTGARARLPVIPHIVGGDDVVVSVTADRAWRFAVTYLEAFGRRMASIEGVPPELLGPIPPSASAGLVFAHAKFPFRRALELAGDQMRAAKTEFCGELPAIGWLDVTRDGERPPAGQSPWQLSDLTGLSDALLALRQQVEPSGRATLGRLIDLTRPPEVSVARVREHARRLERELVLGPFLASGDPAADVSRVASALSLARWWS